MKGYSFRCVLTALLHASNRDSVIYVCRNSQDAINKCKRACAVLIGYGVDFENAFTRITIAGGGDILFIGREPDSDDFNNFNGVKVIVDRG